MCGIVGYIGSNSPLPVLLEGLKRLEYRGYDSAGISILNGSGITTRKTAGKIVNLEKLIAGNGADLSGTVGIGHTRWATHGAPTTRNAHPHTGASGTIAVVHNGIIENWETLKRQLVEAGHVFETETDTEVLTQLVAHYFDGDLEEAVRRALKRVEGTYGIAVVSSEDPDRIIAARNGSPLVLGIGEKENFVASDVAAILHHTRQVIYLDDHELAVVERDTFATTSLDRVSVQKEIEEIAWDLSAIEKGGYPHFMLKEIFEQPETVRNAMRGRFDEPTVSAHLGGLNMSIEEMRDVERIIITACGTSWHAGLIGEYMMEEMARIPVEVEYASEFRYRNPIITPNTVSVAISQSGETMDTLWAMREAKMKGANALGICNVVGSTIARESDGGVYIHAGPEIGVASTKAFTAQITVLALMALAFARLRGLDREVGRRFISEMQLLPERIQGILEKNDEILKIAEEYAGHDNFLYLGRGYNFPVALEGALKLKEISYIHAEGYPAAEMKHGPIALIDKNMPVVFIAPRDRAYEKVIGNIEEVRARSGRVIAIATEGETEITRKADHTILIPETIPCLMPILSVIPLQLLAYHVAVLRACDVDQPRNLAKSVTVE
ncbi:MAG: glutamine--fructose-6-phosphate transaminase (isomerizing) [Gemmatimonadota bacterium]|jgi:glucosamine--fructose-6-phosphate aminotransferase (isomerizing)|nr:glutamine--fructose-6-phosphate transaminase (isomerizing) [Gemmatimonadota bacterium]